MESGQNFSQVLQLWTASLSLRLFQRRFVKMIEFVTKDAVIYYPAQCELEMRTGSAQLKLNYHRKKRATVERVLFAECTPCPVGNVPRACCKHLAALLFTLEEFGRLGFTTGSLVRTDVE